MFCTTTGSTRCIWPVGSVLALVCMSAFFPFYALADDSQELARFDAKIKPADRAHWAYQPVRKPTPPHVKNQAWIRNPIDAFILDRLEQKSWQPAGAAAPRAWLRRVYLDVIGM